MISSLKSALRTFWERFVDPIPRLRREAKAVHMKMETAKRQKKAYKHHEREYKRIMTQIIAFEKGLPYRGTSLDWGR